MIFYLTILIAFIWLGIETSWLTVRLPYGALQCPRKPVEPLRGSEPSTEPPTPLLLTEQCYLSKVHEIMGRQACDHTYGWSPGGYDTKEKPSYQQMLIGGSTITLKATLPNLYKRIADLRKASDSKPSQRVTYAQLPMFVEYTSGGYWKQRGYKSKDEKPKTVFHDCLPGKTWLKKHYKDVIPEPAMELIVDGKVLSVNGNYKSGVIKDFIKSHKS